MWHVLLGLHVWGMLPWGLIALLDPSQCPVAASYLFIEGSALAHPPEPEIRIVIMCVGSSQLLSCSCIYQLTLCRSLT